MSHQKPVKTFDYLAKLYVWSLVFEPLIFFVVFDQSIAGISGNISRLLQFLVIGLMLLRVLLMHTVMRFPNPFFTYYRWYFLYLFFILAATLFGMISGAYESTRVDAQEGVSFFSSILNSPWLRPAFEYFIAFYYFAYFTILAQHLLKDKEAINYFFKIFLGVFFLSFWIGVIDYLLVALWGYEWIPRRLADYSATSEIVHVGRRFHGLAGEPRDAFVYLIFGIGLLYLRDQLYGKYKYTYLWFIVLLVAALLTQSASGYVGLAIGLGLILLIQLPRIPAVYLLPALLILTSIVSVFVINLLDSQRMLNYIEMAPIAIEALKQNTDLPAVILFQVSNIYPIWLRFTDLIQFNFIPIIIGTGIGSSSVANSIFFPEVGVYNPHANIIRIFFEAGIIGTLLFLTAFIQPIRELSLSKKTYRPLMFFTLLVLGVNLGHRSSTIFIFLGIALLVFQHKKNKLWS
jgi:hypothetical protein